MKNDFIDLLRSTNRKGMEETIKNLENLGFFEAPASTRYHLNVEGGLLKHSMNVCRLALAFRVVLVAQNETLREDLPVDSVIIASLLHDVCKADIYKKSTKKDKEGNEYWEQRMGYSSDRSDFPVGHGEKSVIRLLMSGLELTKSEILAIRWHMAPWDMPFQSHDIKADEDMAKKKFPLVTLIQTADVLAARLIEREKK